MMPSSGGIERARMVLDSYDPDERDRLYRLLTDLAEHSAYLGHNFPAVAVMAWESGKARLNNRVQFCGRCAKWHEGRCQTTPEEAPDVPEQI